MTSDITIGKRGYVNNNYHFNGLQDEVVFYNKALTSSEVSALYNGGSGDPTPDTNGLVAHYNFEQTTFYTILITRLTWIMQVAISLAILKLTRHSI